MSLGRRRNRSCPEHQTGLAQRRILDFGSSQELVEIVEVLDRVEALHVEVQIRRELQSFRRERQQDSAHRVAEDRRLRENPFLDLLPVDLPESVSCARGIVVNVVVVVAVRHDAQRSLGAEFALCVTLVLIAHGKHKRLDLPRRLGRWSSLTSCSSTSSTGWGGG